MASIATEFFVPIRDNDNRPFDRAAWRRLYARLVERFEGITSDGGHHGAWLSGGQLYQDENRSFRVDLQSWEDLPEWLDTVRWARVEFRQLAMRIVVAGIPEVIQPRPDRPGGIYIARR